MNRVEIKNLPNGVKLSAYFFNSQENTIQRIEATKSIYVKTAEMNGIEKKDLVLNMEKTGEKNTTFREQILFNKKNIGVTEVYYMYAYSPQKFNTITNRYENYKWSRVKNNPTLLQVWKKPLEYIRLKEFTKLFYGFDEKNPIKIVLDNNDFTQKEQSLDNLDNLLQIAKKDEKLGEFQEFCGYEERYLNRFRRENCR